MGSLVAGWQSNPEDPKEALKRSTSSVTREEVKRFWRAKNETAGSDGRATHRNANQARNIIVPASPGSDSSFEISSSHSGSTPITPTTPSTAALESPSAQSPGWWQRSSWAFLNEPPIMEDRQSRYVSQYHVSSVPPNMDSEAPVERLHVSYNCVSEA